MSDDEEIDAPIIRYITRNGIQNELNNPILVRFLDVPLANMMQVIIPTNKEASKGRINGQSSSQHYIGPPITAEVPELKPKADGSAHSGKDIKSRNRLVLANTVMNEFNRTLGINYESIILPPRPPPPVPLVLPPTVPYSMPTSPGRVLPPDPSLGGLMIPSLGGLLIPSSGGLLNTSAGVPPSGLPAIQTPIVSTASPSLPYNGIGSGMAVPMASSSSNPTFQISYDNRRPPSQKINFLPADVQLTAAHMSIWVQQAQVSTQFPTDDKRGLAIPAPSTYSTEANRKQLAYLFANTADPTKHVENAASQIKLITPQERREMPFFNYGNDPELSKHLIYLVEVSFALNEFKTQTKFFEQQHVVNLLERNLLPNDLLTSDSYIMWVCEFEKIITDAKLDAFNSNGDPERDQEVRVNILKKLQETITMLVDHHGNKISRGDEFNIAMLELIEVGVQNYTLDATASGENTFGHFSDLVTIMITGQQIRRAASHKEGSHLPMSGV